jgi:tetratricopeptide (TPR) repeat protein
VDHKEYNIFFDRSTYHMKKRIIFAAAAIAAALTFGACGSSNEEQEAYRQYGITCMESGNYEDAVQAFQNALDQSLGKVGEMELDICFYKAKAQMLGGDTDAALQTYNAIIDYNGDARAYYLRGNLYFEQGDENQALADYEQAADGASDNYEIYIGIYESMKDHDMAEDAQKYLNQALEIKGNKAEDLLYKGRILEYLGQSEDAEDYLTKSKEKGESLASFYLGLYYEEHGESDKAEECIREYLDSGTATSYELYDLGASEAAAGDYESALTYYNEALSLEKVPNKQNLMKSVISAYEHSGDFESAKEMLSDYLALYPSDEEAQKESTFLETR